MTQNVLLRSNAGPIQRFADAERPLHQQATQPGALGATNGAPVFLPASQPTRTFAAELEGAMLPSGIGAIPDPRTDRERLVRGRARDAAEEFVAQSFFVPLLAQLRETNKAAAPFGTTEAEERLGPIVDGHVANAMVKRARLPLVDVVERSMLGGERGAQPQGPRP